MGMIYETGNPEKALEFYHKAREACKRRGTVPPPELYNNVAVLYQRTGNAQNAMTFYEKALKCYKCPVPDKNGNIDVDDDNEEHTKALKGSAITVLYNLARLSEKVGNLAYADTLYRYSDFPRTYTTQPHSVPSLFL